MTQLSVNVNKIATLRNARGKNNPDVIQTTLDIVGFGAQGVTVHPRPDERHITTDDVYRLAKVLSVELNIEGYPSKAFLNLVREAKPAQCTLVPDPPEVLTSNAGWNIPKNIHLLTEVVAQLHDTGIRTSLFVDPFTVGPKGVALLKQIQTDRIELYTERYAESFDTPNKTPVLETYWNVAEQASGMGIGINAGHDLDLHNLACFLQTIPYVEEVSIGHALICDALKWGLEETISRYLQCIDGASRTAT